EVAVAVGAAAPEVVEADIVERGGGSEAGDVAAEAGVVAVGAQHHGHRVPADVGADAVFDRIVAGGGNLLVDGDGVDVIGGGVERHVHAGVAAMLDQAFEQIMGAFGANFGDDAFQRLEPFVGFLRVDILAQRGCGDFRHGRHPVSSSL